MVISRIETLKLGAPTSVTGNKSAMKSFSSVSKNYIHTLKPFSFLLAAPYLVTFLSTIGRPASGFVYSRFFWSPDMEPELWELIVSTTAWIPTFLRQQVTEAELI